MDAAEPEAGSRIDPNLPSPARVYDVHLGGAHNFAADRELAEQAVAMMPELPALLRANRSFLRRAVRYLTGRGIRQFLDLGSGIPTVGNVHSIAQEHDRKARVLYVDNDPIAVEHGNAVLDGNPDAEAVLADLRDPETVLASPAVERLLDFSQPLAVLAVAVLHFVPDADEPAHVLSSYTDRLAPGSYLALSHATSGGHTPGGLDSAADLYAARMRGFTLRSPRECDAFFSGLELVDPGVVPVELWHPDPGTTPPAEKDALPAWSGVGKLA